VLPKKQVSKNLIIAAYVNSLTTGKII